MMNLKSANLKKAALQHGCPLFVYSREYLRGRAEELISLCQPDGITARYAVKANSHPEIIKIFQKAGLQFDASSEYEAEHLVKLGVPASHISLSSQQPPRDMKKILESGIKFVATSIHQLELVSLTGWKGSLAVRLNPGVGAGHNNRTTTAGKTAGFGVWHEYLARVLEWQKDAGCIIDRLHIHGGSGGDSAAWESVMDAGLALIEEMPGVTTLDIGGGFKIARMPGEPKADMAGIISMFTRKLKEFERKTGRKIDLEIEPGTWLVGNAGMLLAEIIDIVDTGAGGFTFLRLNTGMNDILRPAIYGAQHPIEVLNDSKEKSDYVVVGHNCESGDILTPAPGNPEEVKPRTMNKARIGDLVAIGGAGAYAASMRAVGYNSFPPAAEVFV